MRIRNTVLGAGTFSLVLGVVLLAWLLPAFVSVPVAAQYAPGPTPQSFPRILAWVLVVAGISALVLDAVTHAAERAASEHVFDLRDFVFIAVAVVAYIAAFQLVGFNVSTFSFLFAFFWFFSPLSWVRSITVALAVTAPITVVFAVVLKIPLPSLVETF